MIKKHVKKLSFFLIILCHFGFLATILYEKQNNYFISAFVILSLFLLRVTYKKTSLRSGNHSFEHVLTIAFVFFGAIVTYVLSTSFGVSNVLSAGLVGLVASFVPDVFKRNSFALSIPTSVYCGTFVGMTNVNVATDYIFISLASIITGMLLIATKDSFQGVGGKLGSIAFGGVVLSFSIIYFLSQWI